ncbi:hypothetical protein BDD12DRAFT_302326 [Trichophaea hybrida]|nr:hypothetical protein BDD12DRAFT_302326 [Trichophaea hybrida]
MYEGKMLLVWWICQLQNLPPSPGSPEYWSAGRRGMLIFDLATKSLRNETIDGYGNNNEGLQFGTLHHIKPNNGKGILLSLMAEKALVYPVNLTSDDPYDSEGISLGEVMLYDIEKSKWYKQRAVSFDGEAPPSRTRFCGVVMHDKESQSWDLWLYGGAAINDTNTGVDDIYVLTMPGFMSVFNLLSHLQTSRLWF